MDATWRDRHESAPVWASRSPEVEKRLILEHLGTAGPTASHRRSRRKHLKQHPSNENYSAERITRNQGRAMDFPPMLRL